MYLKTIKFFNSNQNKLTFISIPFLILGLILKNDYLLIITTLLCSIPIILRAISALQMKLISIELLVTIAMIGALYISEYHECAMVSFLFQFGSYLEGKTIKKTRSAIETLVNSAPDKAMRITGSDIEEIDIDDVEVGDLLLIKEGSKIPVDGYIENGEGILNEAAVTGESNPVFKKISDLLYAGTILESGQIQMLASKVGEDTTYARIISLVEESEDSKSNVERFIDKFAKYYTPFVILISLLTFVFTRNIDTSITVLVLACPGALVIGAPIAGISGIGAGAKIGILFKGSDTIHNFAKTNTFIFDKTGTLTKGEMRVNEVISYSNNNEQQFKTLAQFENNSTHPISRAIVNYVESLNIKYEKIPINIENIKGKGMKYENCLIGNIKLLNDEKVEITDQQLEDIQKFQEKGYTIVLLAENKELLMLLGISDYLKDGAIETIKKLSNNETIMLTGDHYTSAKIIADKLKIDSFVADMLPEDKFKYVENCQKENKNVCFIGDGINDSPSIVKADTGIAMGNGTDVAIECSDIVILGSDISKISEALNIAKATKKITLQNLIIAISTVFLLLIGLFAGIIHMGIGMFIHETSILIVIINGARLQMKRR